MLLDQKENQKEIFKIGYSFLKDHVIKGLKEELEKGLRDETDWSIQVKLPCRCEECKMCENFLKSKQEVEKVWPLVAAGRDHIMNALDGFGLPIHLSVKKEGSPHKLVILKDKTIYKRAKERFDKVQSVYQKLSN